MRVGVIGAGRIGGNAGRLLARAGHEVMFCFARSEESLQQAAAEAGGGAQTGSPSDAVAFAEAMVFAVPWTTVDEALRQAGDLSGKVVIDTTNQFGPGGVQELPDGLTAAEFNARRMPGARYVKSLNTLTSGFQAAAAERPAGQRAAMFLGGDDAEAKEIAAQLIRDMGFDPVDVGGFAQIWIIEAPRRDGAVYGEEYRPEDARRIAEALQTDPQRASALASELRVAG
jgi:8-hydroxy-5-deazaflavin:NADPH oxidoreductase